MGSKRAKSRPPVNYWKTALAILTLSASVALAEDFKTIKGKEYKDANVTRVEPDGVVITFRGGMVKIYFVELPKDVQKRFGYDTDKTEAEQAAPRAAEEKRVEEQKPHSDSARKREGRPSRSLNRKFPSSARSRSRMNCFLPSPHGR